MANVDLVDRVVIKEIIIQSEVFPSLVIATRKVTIVSSKMYAECGMISRK